MYKTMDLCAGIGGIRKGFERTGHFENVLSAEIDEYAARTYELNFGDDPRADLTSLEFKKRAAAIGCDVLLAGFPCQPFSSQGNQEGFSDPTKGTIFFSIKQIIKVTRPKAILLENVRNIVSHDNEKTMYIILDSLEKKLNYKVVGVTRDQNDKLVYEKESFIRNTKDFGLPQNRPRAYFIAFDRELYGDVLDQYHALLGEYVANSYEMKLEELNEAFLEKKVAPQRLFDLIIVDEAQDILSEGTMRCLDMWVKYGLSGGEWLFFADPNQDIFLKSNAFSNIVKDIKEKYNPCMLRLLKNCRNTAQIARRNSMLTSIPVSKHMQLTGPEVRAIEFEKKKDFVEKLDKEIRSLMAGGTCIKDIVILSTKRLENSMLSETRTLADIELVEVRNIKGLKKSQINYLTVHSFKGLERKIVFYVDIVGFESMDNRRINYVAMSRAQIMLYYFFPRTMEHEYESRMLEGMEAL